jgi:hypothetical protein
MKVIYVYIYIGTWRSFRVLWLASREFTAFSCDALKFKPIYNILCRYKYIYICTVAFYYPHAFWLKRLSIYIYRAHAVTKIRIFKYGFFCCYIVILQIYICSNDLISKRELFDIPIHIIIRINSINIVFFFYYINIK